MNPNFKYINGFDEREHMIVQVWTKYPLPAVEIRRRGQTNNWNVFMRLEQSEVLTGNLLYGKTVTNEDPTAAMTEAITIASKYLFENAGLINNMIKLIEWKVKTSKNKDFDPDLKFIKLKVVFNKTGEDYWNSWLDTQVENFKMLQYEDEYIFKECVDYHCVTLAALEYLEVLKNTPDDKVAARHTRTSQIQRTIEVLKTYWD